MTAASSTTDVTGTDTLLTKLPHLILTKQVNNSLCLPRTKTNMEHYNKELSLFSCIITKAEELFN